MITSPGRPKIPASYCVLHRSSYLLARMMWVKSGIEKLRLTFTVKSHRVNELLIKNEMPLINCNSETLTVNCVRTHAYKE